MWCTFNAQCKCASVWNVLPNSCPPFQAEYPRQHQQGPGAANPAVEKSWEGSWKVFAAGAWARPLSSRDKLPGGSWRASSFLSQTLGTKFMEAAAIWLRGLRTAEIRLFVMFLLLLGSRVWARKRSRSMLVVLSKKMPEPQNTGCLLSEFLQIQIRKSSRKGNEQGIEKDTWCEYIIKMLIAPSRGKENCCLKQ